MYKISHTVYIFKSRKYVEGDIIGGDVDNKKRRYEERKHEKK